jgi:metal-dependent HD superfamily phosphatase/phosphodiesterase
MTYEMVKQDFAVKTYIRYADAALEALGFTEHSFAHVTKVAETAAKILTALDYPERTVELAKIAGYLHDIGNVVNRVDHSQSGAVMAFRILDRMEFPPEEISTIVSAIGNHDEGTGVPVNPVAAALIIADKSDVRRSRVRDKESISTDIHDRVNYSVTDAELVISEENAVLELRLNVDTTVSSVMEYLEIFMNRMLMCRRACEKLGLQFKLFINSQQLV